MVFLEALSCSYLNGLSQSLMLKKIILWFLPLPSPCPWPPSQLHYRANAAENMLWWNYIPVGSLSWHDCSLSCTSSECWHKGYKSSVSRPWSHNFIVNREKRMLESYMDNPSKTCLPGKEHKLEGRGLLHGLLSSLYSFRLFTRKKRRICEGK